MIENLRTYVLWRDGMCVAAAARLFPNRWPMLAPYAPPDACRDQWGHEHEPGDLSRLTLDHVREAPQMGTYRGAAPDDRDHLWAICWHHHLGGWATRSEVREAARAYIPAANAYADTHGWPRPA